MGRLFWKFFLILWLAQFLTGATIAAAVWLENCPGKAASPFCARPMPFSPESRHAEHLPFPPFGEHPPPLLPIPVIPALAGLLVSLIFAALLAWYFARPIRNLRVAFESVADGNLETRIGTSMGRRRDELADLGKNFDHMAGCLQSLVETQRRLLHDVSHELRSPLARLQAIGDLMLQQPGRSTEFVERIQRDTARMDTLIGELLTLARLDAGMAGKLEGEVDLYEMILEISDNARFEAAIKNCTIQVDMHESVFVHGNHELLHRALENVVRNAVSHLPDGGLVIISCQSANKQLSITVADNGPGVLDEDLTKIFEPFVRSGPARPLSGHGLGLAITRRVVELHGGRISASNRPQGGLIVTLDLQP